MRSRALLVAIAAAAYPARADYIPLASLPSGAATGIIEFRTYSPKGNGTDDSAALAAAINAENVAMAAGNFPCIHIPSGNFSIGSGTAIPTFTQGKPGCVYGDGPDHSNITLLPAFKGDLFSCDEAWIGVNNTSGCSFKHLRINGAAGQSGLAGQQNGIMFYDRNDNISVDDVDFWHVPGYALELGVEKNEPEAYVRESHDLMNIRVFNSGTSTIMPVRVTSQGTDSGQDSTNDVVFTNLRIYGSPGPSLKVDNSDITGLGIITFDHVIIEGLETGCTGDLLTIGDPVEQGTVAELFFYDTHLLDSCSGYDALHSIGPSSLYANGEFPSFAFSGEIGGGLSNGKGIVLDQAFITTFNMLGLGTAGTNVTIGSAANVAGQTYINGYGYEHSWTYSIDSSYHGLYEPTLTNGVATP